MKATLNYASGWVISFPKDSMGPMLFLEWIQNNPSHPKDFTVATKPCIDEVLNDDFVIRWKSGIKETITDCFEYIKSNM